MNDENIAAYLKEISQYSYLNTEQENKLIKDFLEGDQSAKEILIQSNLKLVVYIAKQYQGKGLGLLDLIQEGNIGLITAIEKFDVSKGFRLSTYAIWWIRHYITRALTNHTHAIRMPANIVEDAIKLDRIKNEFCAENGREPSLEELSEVSKMPISKIQKVVDAEKFKTSISMDEPNGNSEELNLGGLIPSKINITKDLENEAVSDVILSVLNTLNNREKFIIIERFGLCNRSPRTLEDIGKELGISKERTRQIENIALRKLRNPARSKALEQCFI